MLKWNIKTNKSIYSSKYMWYWRIFPNCSSAINATCSCCCCCYGQSSLEERIFMLLHKWSIRFMNKFYIEKMCRIWNCWISSTCIFIFILCHCRINRVSVRKHFPRKVNVCKECQRNSKYCRSTRVEFYRIAHTMDECVLAQIQLFFTV